MRVFKASLGASHYLLDVSASIYAYIAGLTMPLLTITLVRTISFTIYDNTKRVRNRRSVVRQMLMTNAAPCKPSFESPRPG